MNEEIIDEKLLEYEEEIDKALNHQLNEYDSIKAEEQILIFWIKYWWTIMEHQRQSNRWLTFLFPKEEF